MRIKLYRKLADFEISEFVKNKEISILIDFERKWFQVKFPIFFKKDYFGPVIDEYTGLEYNDFYKIVKIVKFWPYIRTSSGYNSFFKKIIYDIKVPQNKIKDWEK
jgi:hypothetical protein